MRDHHGRRGESYTSSMIAVADQQRIRFDHISPTIHMQTAIPKENGESLTFEHHMCYDDSPQPTTTLFQHRTATDTATRHQNVGIAAPLQYG